MTELRILLATPHAGYEQRVRQAYGESLNGELRRIDLDRGEVSADALLARLDGLTPDVVAIGPEVELEDALGVARGLELHRPEISVLLVSEPSESLWQQALRAGVRDVVAPDANEGELRGVFDRAIEVAAQRRRNLVGDTRERASDRRIITVLSPKGGSGKTVVASNIALGIAAAHPDGVAIVDLDLQFGDVASSLRLQPEYSIGDVVRGPGDVDAMKLKAYLTAHAGSLWALCAPGTPAEAEDIDASHAQAVVEALSGEFRHVVVDTPAGLGEHTLAALEVSSDWVLLCGMDVPSVTSMRRTLDALDRLGMTGPRRHLVVNRVDRRVGVDLIEIEAAMGMPIDVTIASSRSVAVSTNHGIPVVESSPGSQVGRQLTALAQRFIEQAAPPHRTRRRAEAGR